MADFVSRDTILEKLNKKFCAYCPLPDCDANCKLHYLLDAVKEAPAVDVRPVVKGKWDRLESWQKWQCSACGVLMDIDGTPQENLLNFCPNCGADMREADNNG